MGLDEEQVQADVERLRAGRVTPEDLLSEYLEGVELPESDSAWREYVSAVAMAARR